MEAYDEVLTFKEAQQVLKISGNTLSAIIKAGRLRGTYMVVGKNRLRFRKSKLLDYIGMEVYENVEIDDDDCEEDAAEA